MNRATRGKPYACPAVVPCFCKGEVIPRSPGNRPSIAADLVGVAGLASYHTSMRPKAQSGPGSALGMISVWPLPSAFMM